MKKIVTGALIVFGLLILIAIISSLSADDVFVAENKPFQLFGEGNAITRQFNLEKGMSRFYINNSPKGENPFSVVLQDDNGAVIQELIEVQGGYAGWKDIEIPSSDTYTLKVEADGEWLVTVE